MEVLYKKVFENFGVQYYENFNMIPNKDNPKNDSDTFGCLSATNKYPHFKYLKSSTDKDDFILNYGNMMTNVFVSRVTFVVELFEDKISMKLYKYHKQRDAGKPYFRKASCLDFVTYKFERNDLFFGKITSGKRKKTGTRMVRRNYFGGTPGPISNIALILNDNLSMFKAQSGLNVDCNEIIKEAIDCFTCKIPGFNQLDNVGTKNIDEQLYKNYLKLKNIKYPNNFTAFMNKVPAPNKRLLKKFNNKLVDCFMHTHKMGGDKIKKVLHNVDVINEFCYKECINLFGEKFIKNQPYNDLEVILSYKNGYNFRGLKPNFTDKEKKLAFSTLIDFMIFDGSLSTYLDHIEFYEKLNKVEKVKWTAYDLQSFREEHIDWTDKWSYYTKGTYYRHYNEDFISKVTQPLGNNYYPLILVKSKEYIDESALQSNCVKTYVDKPQSLIISIRENDINSDERATIEYSIRQNIMFDGKPKIILKRVQNLGKFNQKLNEKWDSVLVELDNRINKYINDFGFELPKVTVDFKHRKVVSESGFTDRGLVWLSPILNNTFNYDTDFLF